MVNDFLDTSWQETLKRLYQEMLDENALYEELSDENELKTEKEIGELFEYHRLAIAKDAKTPD